MKVVEINPLCGYGCTGRIAVDLQNALEQNGNECVIAYNREPSVDCSKYRIGTKLTMYTHALFTRLVDRQGFSSKKEMRKFWDFLNRYHPDLIHFHVMHGNYIYLPGLIQYINIHKIPVVYTFHDCWAFTGHCVYFDYIGCEKYQTECNHCPKKRQHPASWLLDQSRRNYKEKRELLLSIENLSIVTPSHWMADLVGKSFLKNVPIHVIPNGIDTSDFQPLKSSFKKDFQIEGKKVIFGCANGWSATKGLADFIYLSEQMNHDKYAIVLVGLTHQQMKELPVNIIGIEKTQDIHQLAEYYSMADVFVNPTYEDNFPTTNLEALACGTPVVTYNTGGSPECISYSCGRVVEQGNKKELLNTIQTVLNEEIDPLECRTKALEYEKNVQYEKYITLFEKINSCRRMSER